MAVDDLGPQFVKASSGLLAITSLLLIIRIGERYDRGVLGWDDFFIFLSWVFHVAFAAAGLAAVPYGFGKHMSDLPVPHQQSVLRLIMMTSATWSVGVAFAKASFACLYLRLISNRSVGRLNRAVIAFQAVQAFVQVTYEVFQCIPVQKAWDASVPGSCISVVPMWWMTFICNISIDLILFIQPIPYIWQLQQMSAAKKAGVILMLSLGLFICMISVVRILQSVRADNTDVSYQLVEPIIWSNAEISAMISCACIPTLKQAGSHIRRIALPPRPSGGSAPSGPRQGQPRTPGNMQRGRVGLLAGGDDTLFSWRFKGLTLSSKQTSGAAASTATTAVARNGVWGVNRSHRLEPTGVSGRFGTTSHISSAGMVHDEGQHGETLGVVAESERAATSASPAGSAGPPSIAASGGRTGLPTQIMVTREVNHDVTEAWPQDVAILQRAFAEAWLPHLSHPEDVEAGPGTTPPEPQSRGGRISK